MISCVLAPAAGRRSLYPVYGVHLTAESRNAGGRGASFFIKKFFYILPAFPYVIILSGWLLYGRFRIYIRSFNIHFLIHFS